MAKRMKKTPRPGDPYDGPALIVLLTVIVEREGSDAAGIYTHLSVQGDGGYVNPVTDATDLLRPHVEGLRDAIGDALGGIDVLSDFDVLAARRTVGRA